ncbi:hypothetical protein [Duganella sp. CF458]|uniref:hypothetical protein n=1 Tax=Duganella sp. CF458 TaxID=1884368 RepID=UPI001113DB7C|nr:hypothetical protein [Duganella sp. CF458]
METLKAAMVGAILVAAGIASADSGFQNPIFIPVKEDACPSDKVSVSFSPDKSSIAILRKDGYFLQTPKDSKINVKARCKFDLVISRSPADPPVLQLDFRGAEHKFPASELDLKVTVGSTTYRAYYPRGQLRDGSPNFMRFQLPIPRSGKLQVEIEAKARSFDGKDGVQLSVDSIDACFANSDATEACAALAAKKALAIK